MATVDAAIPSKFTVVGLMSDGRQGAAPADVVVALADPSFGDVSYDPASGVGSVTGGKKDGGPVKLNADSASVSAHADVDETFTGNAIVGIKIVEG